MNLIKSLYIAAISIFLTSPTTMALQWGEFKDNGCVGNGLHSYSSVLWDIPWGQSWETTCAETDAMVPTSFGEMYFSHPTQCVKTSIVDAVNILAYLVGFPGLVYPAAGVAGVVIGSVAQILEFADWGALNMWGVFYIQDPGCP